MVAEAAEAEAYWRQCWAAAGIYVSQREMDEKAAAAAAARAAAEAGKLDSAWRAAARKVGWRARLGLGGRPLHLVAWVRLLLLACELCHRGGWVLPAGWAPG